MGERNKATRFRNSLKNDRTYHCHDCGKPLKKNPDTLFYRENQIVLHHIIPIIRGGTSNKDNLVILCDDCHNKRHRELDRKPELPLFRENKQNISGYDLRGVILKYDK